jgi:adenylosuccinate lyase
MVQRQALASASGEGDFRALLAADPEIAARLSSADLARAFDLEHHLRHAGAIVDRALSA